MACLLPAPDGMEVLRRLRARADGTPVLMLTARSAFADRGDRVSRTCERVRVAKPPRRRRTR